MCYILPVNPPHVPDENPTGIYKKTVVLDEQWMEKDTVLKFHGVDSAFDVWVNGNHVGFGKVSRLPSEFDITGFVKQVKMTLPFVYTSGQTVLIWKIRICGGYQESTGM